VINFQNRVTKKNSLTKFGFKWKQPIIPLLKNCKFVDFFTLKFSKEKNNLNIIACTKVFYSNLTKKLIQTKI